MAKSKKNPTDYYLELVNSLLSDVMEEKYQAVYGLRLANTILKGFSYGLNNMIKSHPSPRSMTNIMEIYVTVSYIADIYFMANDSLPADLDFPVIPKSWDIIAITFDKSTKSWIIICDGEGSDIIVSRSKDFYKTLTNVAGLVNYSDKEGKEGKEVTH